MNARDALRILLSLGISREDAGEYVRHANGLRRRMVRMSAVEDFNDWWFWTHGVRWPRIGAGG